MTKTARRDADDRAQIRGYRTNGMYSVPATPSGQRRGIGLAFLILTTRADRGNSIGLGGPPLIFRSAQERPDELGSPIVKSSSDRIIITFGTQMRHQKCF